MRPQQLVFTTHLFDGRRYYNFIRTNLKEVHGWETHLRSVRDVYVDVKRRWPGVSAELKRRFDHANEVLLPSFDYQYVTDGLPLDADDYYMYVVYRQRGGLTFTAAKYSEFDKLSSKHFTMHLLTEIIDAQTTDQAKEAFLDSWFLCGGIMKLCPNNVVYVDAMSGSYNPGNKQLWTTSDLLNNSFPDRQFIPVTEFDLINSPKDCEVVRRHPDSTEIDDMRRTNRTTEGTKWEVFDGNLEKVDRW